jgi:hypothetical protein
MLVPFTTVDATTVYVESGLVSSLTEVPGASPPATYIDLTGADAPTRVAVLGTMAATAAALAAGAPASSGTYAPTTSIAGGPIALLAGFAACFSRVGQVVTVTARATTTWSSNGVGSITISPPPGLPLAPGETFRGVGSSAPNPYAAAPFTEAPPIVYTAGADMGADIANTVGAPLPMQHTFVFQYVTP